MQRPRHHLPNRWESFCPYLVFSELELSWPCQMHAGSLSAMLIGYSYLLVRAPVPTEANWSLFVSVVSFAIFPLTSLFPYRRGGRGALYLNLAPRHMGSHFDLFYLLPLPLQTWHHCKKLWNLYECHNRVDKNMNLNSRLDKEENGTSKGCVFKLATYH